MPRSSVHTLIAQSPRGFVRVRDLTKRGELLSTVMSSADKRNSCFMTPSLLRCLFFSFVFVVGFFSGCEIIAEPRENPCAAFITISVFLFRFSCLLKNFCLVTQ